VLGSWVARNMQMAAGVMPRESFRSSDVRQECDARTLPVLDAGSYRQTRTARARLGFARHQAWHARIRAARSAWGSQGVSLSASVRSTKPCPSAHSAAVNPTWSSNAFRTTPAPLNDEAMHASMRPQLSHDPTFDILQTGVIVRPLLAGSRRLALGAARPAVGNPLRSLTSKVEMSDQW